MPRREVQHRIHVPHDGVPRIVVWYSANPSSSHTGSGPNTASFSPMREFVGEQAAVEARGVSLHDHRRVGLLF